MTPGGEDPVPTATGALSETPVPEPTTPEPAYPEPTAAEAYTCYYGDVDGQVEVPCDSDACVLVGCLRSDGVYIGPAAEEMNSANAVPPTP